MSELTAVDILLEPDASMLARAEAENGRMLTSIPSPPGFHLDEHHRPHITTLQRYVRTDALEDMYAAIERVVGQLDLSKLTFTAEAIKHMEVQPSVGIAAVVVKPGPEVLDFQARLIEALKPFTGSGGTADAYVRTEAEPDINDATITYIENYVPDHSGANYVAHVTVGIAKLDDLTGIEAETFEPLTFSASAVSIYQLGNNGTAAKQLKTFR
ncbi:hypothetical protein SAMN04487846_3262 [Microbacterium sp. cf046]|uniref:hypothetical protein n=1 Tax=Microbacterium sp. cf046 TaxID=1761803 RepID=UPI0008EABF15|nr:hypothetical protein [Microbacterium sp. cf046]SFS16193.1 hypothetical protein SAMN04487846_3262 [Microbacterium sp. cf046]